MKVTERKLKRIIRSIINESNEFIPQRDDFINTSIDHSLEDAAEKCKNRLLEFHQNSAPEEFKNAIITSLGKYYPQYNELTELSPSEYQELITLSIISLVMIHGSGPLSSSF